MYNEKLDAQKTFPDNPRYSLNKFPLNVPPLERHRVAFTPATPTRRLSRSKTGRPDAATPFEPPKMPVRWFDNPSSTGDSSGFRGLKKYSRDGGVKVLWSRGAPWPLRFGGWFDCAFLYSGQFIWECKTVGFVLRRKKFIVYAIATQFFSCCFTDANAIIFRNLTFSHKIFALTLLYMSALLVSAQEVNMPLYYQPNLHCAYSIFSSLIIHGIYLFYLFGLDIFYILSCPVNLVLLNP